MRMVPSSPQVTNRSPEYLISHTAPAVSKDKRYCYIGQKSMGLHTGVLFQGHTMTFFCKITVRSRKHCLEISKAQETVEISR